MKLSLQTRFLLLSGFLIALVGVAAAVLVERGMTRELLEELTKKTYFMGQYLKDTAERKMLVDDFFGLKTVLRDLLHAEEELRYAVVVDRRGEVVAHTFPGRLPAGLLEAHILQPGESKDIRTFASDEGRILDLALPLMDGELGFLRLGVSDQHMMARVRGMRNTLVALFVAFLLGGGLLVVFSVSRITRPLRDLVNVAGGIGKGDLGLRARSEGGTEIEELAGVMNRMAESLSSTLVSRDHLDGIIGAMGEALIVADQRGTIRTANPAVSSLLGREDEDLTGLSLSILRGDAGGPVPEFFTETVSENRGLRNREDYFVRSDGKTITVIVSVDILAGTAADNSTYVIVARDYRELKEAETELRRSHEFTRGVLDSIRDAICIIDVDTFAIVGANQAFLDEYSLTAEDVAGKTCYEVTHRLGSPCNTPEHHCPIVAGDYERPAVVEHVHSDRNGEKRYEEISVAPIRDDGGRVYQVVHLARDTTERRLAEEELTKKHKELKELFAKVETAKREWERTMDCIGDMILLTDTEGRVRRYNEAARVFAGADHGDLLGVSWKAVFGDVEEDLVPAEGERTEYFHESSGRWFLLGRYGVTDAEGTRTGSVITAHDFTDRRRMAAELETKNREIEEHSNSLKTALEKISGLIVAVADKGDFAIRYNNPNLAICHEEKQCDNTECPCYSTEPERCWHRAGTFCQGEVQGSFAKKIGDCRQCIVYRKAASDPEYQIGEQFNDMMFILESKNMELQDAYNQLKAAQSHLLQQEKMASIGQLAAGVAHEINNPMGFIGSNLATLGKYVSRLEDFIKVQTEVLDTLVDGDVSEKLRARRKALKIDYVLDDVKALIDESLEGADRVKAIVQNLKSFSRVDQAERKYANLNECLESTLNVVWNEIKYKATVRKEYGDIPAIPCYPQQLNQVFMNLLVNAAHAIEKQGEITIRTFNGGNTVKVAVSDTGTGIPADKIDRIFEPFFTTKEVGTGTGLGLSISYDIVKKHNGTIDVESEPGKGTTFTVSIPIRNEEEDG